MTAVDSARPSQNWNGLIPRPEYFPRVAELRIKRKSFSDYWLERCLRPWHGHCIRRGQPYENK
jgi:hypothetical protein